MWVFVTSHVVMLKMTAPEASKKQFRWQWRLVNGASVEALIDTGTATETVLQGTRVLSKSPRGEKDPDGHAISAQPEREPGDSERPPIEAVVSFDPKRPVCILRVEGHEIAPSVWPMREARASSAGGSDSASSPYVSSSPRPIGGYIAGGLFIAALIAVCVVLVMRRNEEPVVVKKLDGLHRAPNGLFVAHYPPDDYTLKPAILPLSMGGIILENKAHTQAIVMGAIPLVNSAGGDPQGQAAVRDPWTLQLRLHAEALVNIPKADGRYEETGRREDMCLGEHGAVVLGLVTQKGGGPSSRARIWSCTFTHKDAAYIMMYMLADPVIASNERDLRSVIDATELTQLADLGLGVGNTPFENSSSIIPPANAPPPLLK